MPDFSQIVQTIANSIPGYRDQQQQLANTADVQAQAQGRKLDNYQKQMDQEQQKKFQDFQARMAALAKPEDMPDPKNPDSVGEYLEKQGADYVRGGFINEGSKIIEEGIKMKSLGENAKRAAAQDTLMQLKIRKEVNDAAAAHLAGVTDQEGFDRAIKGTELEGKVKYTGPDSVKQAKTWLTDLQQQDKEKENLARDADREQGRKVQEERARSQREYQKGLLDLRNKELATKAGKEIKNSATSPSAEDTKRARDLVVNFHPGIKENPDALAAASTTIAGAAKRIMAKTGADWPSAVHQALKQYQNSFQDIGKSTQFVGGGDSADEALPLPKAVTEDRDPSTLVKDKYYEFPNGRVGRWTGTGFKVEDDTPPDEEDGGEKSEWDDNTAPLEGDE